MREDEFEGSDCIDQPWKCLRCGALLGYAMDIEGDTHLRIKMKDQYIYIVEPKAIVVTCRKCSFQNDVRRTANDQ